MAVPSVLRGAYELVSSLRFLPHVAVFLRSPARSSIEADVRRWLLVKHHVRPGPIGGLLHCLIYYPEFRSLFYFRIGLWGRVLCILARGMPTLMFGMPRDELGPGMFIQHGFATVISARSVGSGCWINQQVTIGYTDETSCPTIEDDVTIGAGAIVLGDITVGRGTVVAANAVVVQDTPPGAVVAGVPARVVRIRS